MEVCVNAPRLRYNLVFPDGSVVRDVLTRFIQLQGVSSEDFYVARNGRLSDLEDPLEHGAVYHLEPRLCGGKGGFGSMLRALGAQIEKTTNREACRDLSGRRLRDVNHEKEMAEWLKKQAEREAEKEQRRLERLQRKLAEPKHQFTDPEYQQQCHDLSERLEDSVLKGLQASSSSQVKVDDISAAKRPNSDQSEEPEKKKKKKKTAAASAACFWTGVGELDGVLSSEEDDDDDDDESPSTSSSSCRAVTKATLSEKTELEQSGSSSSAHQTVRPSEDQRPPEPSKASESSCGSQQQQAPADQSVVDQSVVDQAPVDQAPVDQSVVDQAPADQAPANQSVVDQAPVDQSVADQAPVDLSSVTSVQQLESLGLDVLKEELMSRGLKCGGTLSERAARLFSVRGLTPDQINPDLLAKPGKTRKK
ncbi:splicing regulator SDE2 isoform X1 [Seriola aureovittata]|uniref:splicing regulator SDE2 isoform X1 n=1 Tax=Seriola aureovittata TaxID=2871759 RepID=UPI0024BD71D7|nr:splicing regulator SDE2 isoform X1 [Seriola aureovittata]